MSIAKHKRLWYHDNIWLKPPYLNRVWKFSVYNPINYKNPRVINQVGISRYLPIIKYQI